MIVWGILNIAFGAPISGIVTHETVAISGASVYIFDANQQYLEATTNTDGWFEFNNAPDDWLRILVVTPVTSNAIPSYYPQQAEYCAAERIDGRVAQSIDIHLETGVQAVITLSDTVDPSGILLMAQPELGLLRGGWTNADGEVWIGGLPPETAITLSMEGERIPDQWVSAMGDTTYQSDESAPWNIDEIDGLNIPIREGITISGLIHHGSTPIPDARVSVYSNSQIRNTTTDDNGFYTIQGLPPGEVLAWMSADGYANTYSPSDDRPTTFVPVETDGMVYDLLDMDAPLESIVSITLLDALTDEPIQGASVLLYNDTRTVGRGEPVDDNGTATIRGLHGGLYQAYIYAKNDGYSNGYILDELGEPLWLEVNSESHVEFQTHLESKNDALIEILDDFGNPVSGVFTLLTQEDNNEIYERDYSDVDGMALLYGLDSGNWTLTLSFIPYCSNDVGYLIPDLPVISIPQQAIDTIVILRDDDQDGMSTQWELDWGLNPNINDASDDPDNDGLSNLEEYYANSNPFDPEPKSNCGCNQRSSQAWLWLTPWIFWRRQRG